MNWKGKGQGSNVEKKYEENNLILLILQRPDDCKVGWVGEKCEA